MRWFKHLTRAHRDEAISALIAADGLEAYGFFWLLCEVVAESMDKSDRCELTHPLPQWSRLLYSHHHRVGKYLGKLRVTGVCEVEYVEGGIRVRIPNLLKYRDEYTGKLRARSRSESGPTPEQDRDRDRDRETEEESPSSRPDPPIFEADSRELKAAAYLHGKIQNNNPAAKAPNLQRWAREFDLMFRVDGREPREVAKVIDWCQADPFWLTNILSPAKLRKQYDRLLLTMKNPRASPAKTSTGSRVIRTAPLSEE